MIAVGTAALTPRTAQAQTAEFGFNQSRPRLVILLHGVTPKPTEAPEQRIGYPGHARHYWGFEFIKGLQGHMEEPQMRVVTPRVGGAMRIRTAALEDWQPSTTDTSVLDLAPICFPTSWLAVDPSMENNQTFIRDYIKLMTKQGSNHTMVMINTRDGSKHLMPQLKETIEELYMSYNTAFGTLPEAQQPQIYLVGHSFGGVIARALLANPTGGDLWGNKLSATDRAHADYLRRRVVLVQTLAAPHEGTLIGDPANDFADFVTRYGYTIIYNFINNYNFWSFKSLTAAQIKAKAKETVKLALDAISGKRDCLQDLARMHEYNVGILHPNTARRSLNGSIVPIFTAAGRNPGGRFFDQSRSMFIFGGSTYNPISVLDLLTGTRPSKEAASLYLIERLMHEEGYGLEGKMPWGSAEYWHGDRVSSPFKGIGPYAERPLSAGWTPTWSSIKGVLDAFVGGAPFKFGQGDGEWDSDGFLAWDSANAYHLISPNFYRVFEPAKYGSLLPWDNDNHGSIMFNPATGAWIHNELVRNAGPFVYFPGSRRSSWTNLDYPTTPATGLKLEVLELKDFKNNIDTFTQADFTLRVRLGATETTRVLPDNRAVHTNLSPFTISNYPNTIIPIRIDCVERDSGNSVDPDDLCVMSPKPGQSSLYLYMDMRTGRMMGDANAAEGQIFEIKPIWWSVSNQVSCKLRLTRTAIAQ